MKGLGVEHDGSKAVSYYIKTVSRCSDPTEYLLDGYNNFGILYIRKAKEINMISGNQSIVLI